MRVSYEHCPSGMLRKSPDGNAMGCIELYRLACQHKHLQAAGDMLLRTELCGRVLPDESSSPHGAVHVSLQLPQLAEVCAAGLLSV